MIEPEFSRIIEVERLIEGESDITIEAKVEEAASLAKRLDIEKINKLVAKIHFKNDRSDRYVQLRGTIEAEIVQLCVVTLKPLPVKISAPIIRNYCASANKQAEPVEIDISSDYEDPPELIIQGVIDVGEAVAEQLALEIDPFPRSPGTEFQGFTSDSANSAQSKPDSDQPTGPFAILAKLKGPSEN